MNLDIVQIKMLEIGKAAEMIEEQDCDYLAVGHFVPAIAMFFPSPMASWRFSLIICANFL
jgi:hypothetical protein